MRLLYLFLALLLVSCEALSNEEAKYEINDGLLDGVPTLPPSSDAVLLVIWTKLNELSEQMKDLNEKTTELQISAANQQATTDNLQSAMLLLTDRMVELENNVEENSNTLTNVATDVTGTNAQVTANESELKNLKSEIQQLQNSTDEMINDLQTEVTSEMSDIQDQVDHISADHCPLGMENYFIKDSQISASSYYSSYYQPGRARLNIFADGAGDGAWIPASNNKQGGWIQVDLLTSKTVTGIITQGREDLDHWTKTFNVFYGDDASNINAIVDSTGNVKVFSGNFDRNTKVVNLFDQPIKARYVRVVAQTYKDYSALRMELLSC